MQIVRLILVTGLIVLALGNACGPLAGGFDPAAVSRVGSSSSDPGMGAFKDGLYSFVNERGCVKCHGNIVHPTFASPDLATAYAAAKGSQIGSSQPLVDFNDPTNSIFIVYAGNGHCGDTPCQDPSVRPQVQAALVAWAQAELGGSTGTAPTGPVLPTYLTSTLAIPASLPNLTVATPAVLRFPLANLNPLYAKLANAMLEVEIQLVNPTEYRVARPKIVGISGPITIGGIHVFVRPASASGVGMEDTSQGTLWDTISATAPPMALPNPLPTQPFSATPLSPLALGIMVQSAADVMTIGFDSLN